MADPRLHVIFKTHLDLGFTGLAEQVRRAYHDHFIPMALDTGTHFLREGAHGPRFVWTTGAWLIWDHLETQDAARVRRLEQGIAAGIIRWHAMPFTTHTELMSPRMLREAIGIARELDRRFGLVTRAAKMTDVPGHTIAAAAVMADEGIEFLHLGVNAACPVPDVPPVFDWHVPGGRRLTVMYQGSYGDTLVPAGATDGIAFAHTSDNLGPQGVSQVIDAFRLFHETAPGLHPVGSTLDAFWDSLRPHRDALPVVTDEIGDTWIHGIATAPRKVSRYLALQRALDDGPMTPARRAAARKAIEVAEHTWGVDIKTFLRDEQAWSLAALARARQDDPRFAFAESSWAEQEATIDAALALLPPDDRAAAQPLPPPIPPVTGWHPVDDTPLTVGGWTIGLSAETGAILRLSVPDGATATARAGGEGLLAFTQTSFDAADLDRWMASYLVDRPAWALLDHGRPGLSRHDGQASQTWRPGRPAWAATPDALWLRAEMPADAVNDRGAPATVLTCLAATDSGLRVTLLLPGKRANRQPEALHWHLHPALAPGGLTLRKMGQPIDPTRCVPGGARTLHAVEAVAFATAGDRRLHATPRDAPLWQAAGQPLLDFSRRVPDPQLGGAFVLAANTWGTNFPQWIEGDLAFTLDLAFG